MLVDDTDVKTQLGPIYRSCLAQLWETIYKDRLEVARADPTDPEMAQLLRIQRSAQHLADHFEQYPLLLFSFVQFDPTGGSIFPATWSAMLAARAEGIGSSLTSVFMFQIDAVLEILGVPKQGGWLFSSCVTFGYPTGRWAVAPRRPVDEVSYRNRWGDPLGFEVPEPLWP
jgi:nitroreductase